MHQSSLLLHNNVVLWTLGSSLTRGLEVTGDPDSMSFSVQCPLQLDLLWNASKTHWASFVVQSWSIWIDLDAVRPFLNYERAVRNKYIICNLSCNEPEVAASVYMENLSK